MKGLILIFLAIIVGRKSETCSFDLEPAPKEKSLVYLSCRIESSFEEIMKPSSTKPSKFAYPLTAKNMYFYLDQPQILDNNLLIEKYFQLLIENGLIKTEYDFRMGPIITIDFISFTNIIGMDIDHSCTDLGRSGYQSRLRINYDFSHFRPFSNGRALINDCDIKGIETNQTSLVLDQLLFGVSTRYYKNFCTIFFKNAIVKTIELHGISSSLLGDNRLTFDYLTKNGTIFTLNASITTLVLDLYLDKIDKGLLNDQVLQKTEIIKIYGKLDRIEPCIFESYSRVYLHLVNLKVFLHSGIRWCPINQPNGREFFLKIENPSHTSRQSLNSMKNKYMFPVEDICIFRNLLSDGKHYFLLEEFSVDECSCSIFWLVHNYNQNPSHQLLHELYSAYDMFSICTENKTYDEWMEECDFDNRFAKCDLNQSTRAEAEWTAFDTAFLVAGFKYAFAVVLLPIVCVIGLVTSCLQITVLRKMIAKLAEKPHDDTSKRSRLMYSYLLQHAVGSAAVCALFAFKPLTECVSYAGIYCSPVYISWHTRLFEAIGLNLLGTALKLHTTSTALLFSLARLAINVKNKKRRSIRIFSKMQPAYVSLVCFLFSLLLSSVKLFTSNDYSAFSWTGDIFISFKIPSLTTFFIYYSNFVGSDAFYFLNISLEVLLDLFIPLMNVVIDIILLRVMHEQNANRSNLSQQLQALSEKKEKQFTKMIILNGISNFIFRIPVLISNILEFIVLTNFHFSLGGLFIFSFQFCQFDDYPFLSLCPAILSISNLFLQLGYIVDFVLLVRFNNSFQTTLKEQAFIRRFIRKSKNDDSLT
nr:G protein-coupled receptor [Proales similis]